jgi:tRNA U38,U39,U40 pseudouridine synthase TruA
MCKKYTSFPSQICQIRIRYSYVNLDPLPVQISNVYPVCRTDAGVHAYCNTATVDLAATPERGYIAPRAITASVNTFFLRKHLDVR